MVNCYACKKDIAPGDIHYKAGKTFCGHCWGHARDDAAERGIELK